MEDARPDMPTSSLSDDPAAIKAKNPCQRL